MAVYCKRKQILLLIKGNRNYHRACSGLAFSSCQAPTQPLSHSPSSAGWGRKYDEKAHGRDKGKDISYQLPSQAKQTRLDLGKISLLPSNIELDGEKQRKKLKHLPLTLFFPDSNSLLHSQLVSLLSPSSAGGWGMGPAVSSGQFFSAALSSSHFSLLQRGSSPQATVLQDKAAPAWVHHRTQFLSGEPAPVWALHGLPCLQDISTSTGSSVDICSTMTLSMGCREIPAPL